MILRHRSQSLGFREGSICTRIYFVEELVWKTIRIFKASNYVFGPALDSDALHLKITVLGGPLAIYNIIYNQYVIIRLTAKSLKLVRPHLFLLLLPDKRQGQHIL